MKKMSGIGASEGVSIGKALLFIEEEIVIPQEKISGDMVGSQLIKLEEGLKKSKTQLIAQCLLHRR